MWVSPDWVHPSFSAARVKLPSSTAVSMASHFLVSTAAPPVYEKCSCSHYTGIPEKSKWDRAVRPHLPGMSFFF